MKCIKSLHSSLKIKSLHNYWRSLVPIEKFGQMMFYHVTYLLHLSLIVYQNLWHSGYVSKLTRSPLHIYQILLLFWTHAYADNKKIVIFIKETNNVKEAFPTVKLSSPKQKITAMNGITIVEFQLMWIDIMHLHKLLNIAVQISEHTRTIAKVTDKKLLTSEAFSPQSMWHSNKHYH